MPHIRLASGVYRTTFRGRFSSLDPFINRIIRDNISAGESFVVEDWAASACLTSLEWAESLYALFPHVTFSASDLELFLISVENPSGEFFVFERNGTLLQYIHAPFVIRMQPPEPWILPVNRLLYLQGKARSRKPLALWPLPEEWLNDFSNQNAMRRENFILRKLLLIHPQAARLAQRDSRFSIRCQSVFEKSAKPCHVIRSMNILNRAYFSEELLARGVQSIGASLEPGGLWIVGRTVSEDPPTHEVTVFRKEHNGSLQVLERIGPGSEIEPFALACMNRGGL
jgi:hypothetical protein